MGNDVVLWLIVLFLWSGRFRKVSVDLMEKEVQQEPKDMHLSLYLEGDPAGLHYQQSLHRLLKQIINHFEKEKDNGDNL